MSYNLKILVIVDDVGSEPGYRSQRAERQWWKSNGQQNTNSIIIKRVKK